MSSRGNRIERARKKLERIHRERLREQAERIRECVKRDACEKQDCVYYALPEDVEELIVFACEALAEDFQGKPQPVADLEEK
jgi:uncharacterized protein YdhG (YjbR/CyaY superfamily)